MAKTKRKKKNKNIIIQDWAGNELFQGPCDSPRVLKIMRKNEAPNDDIFVSWVDEDRTDNVYEHIDF